jgi:gas vesicle protein GvpL/GvpF
MPGLYVYGIVGQAHPSAVAELAAVGGDAAGPVHRVEAAGVAAVTSAAPAELRGKRRDLLAHQRVLDTLAEQGAVLPMRFGVVAADEPALIASLRKNSAHYQRLLRELAGRVEWNVKAVPDEQAFIAAAAQEPAVHTALQAARRANSHERQLELGQVVAEAVHRRVRLSGDEILSQLKPFADRATIVDGGGSYALNAAFLVERQQVPRFQQAIDEVRARIAPALELVLTGPLPPYSFVSG